MGLENRYSVYPVAEMVHISSEGTTPVPVFSIPDGMVINQVLVVVKTPNEDADANNLIVGDNDDDNGFIVAADSKAAAGTIYGDDPAERGAYLKDDISHAACPATSAVYGSETVLSAKPKVKAYSTPKTLYFALSADMLTTEAEGEYLIYIFGHRAIPL